MKFPSTEASLRADVANQCRDDPDAFFAAAKQQTEMFAKSDE